MSLVGKVGVFTSVNDGAWGKEYGNKQCTVIEHQRYVELDELLVEFEDGTQLTFGVDEFELIIS